MTTVPHLIFDLCRALEHEDVVSYGEVTRATLGTLGQRLVEVLLIISQAGAAPALWPTNCNTKIPNRRRYICFFLLRFLELEDIGYSWMKESLNMSGTWRCL